jgi:hypothetical protein
MAFWKEALQGIGNQIERKLWAWFMPTPRARSIWQRARQVGVPSPNDVRIEEGRPTSIRRPIRSSRLLLAESRRGQRRAANECNLAVQRSDEEKIAQLEV